MNTCLKMLVRTPATSRILTRRSQQVDIQFEVARSATPEDRGILGLVRCRDAPSAKRNLQQRHG